MIGTRKRVLAGLRLNPWRFCVTGFLAFSAIWTLLEPITQFIGFDPRFGWTILVILIIVSLSVALVLSIRSTQIRFRPRLLNCELELKFGDLFEVDGIKAIPVNDFFDVQLGRIISERSVHGQFITRVWGGRPEGLTAVVEEALPGTFDEVDRKEGNTRRFPIGTTIMIEANGDPYALTAIAHTDPETHKVRAEIRDLWMALDGLWNRVREQAGGTPVAIPLFGGGLSGVGLPPQQLLNILVLSIISSAKKQEITSRVTIVLAPSLFDEIDLKNIKVDWG